MKSEIIAAISTPQGSGAINIIRMSGEGCLLVAQNFFDVENPEPGKLNLGYFRCPEFNEKCFMVYFRAPRSYTGEEMVEFQVHGGEFLTGKILEKLIAKGARPAFSGEFTKRAFLNGKLSLDRAEGIIDVINAESDAELYAAESLAGGNFFKDVQNLQSDVLTAAAELEVALDYPEHDEEEPTRKSVAALARSLIEKIEKITDRSACGSLLKKGYNIVLAGLPNVGKSSIMNALVGFDRAIVTDIEGTTRDSLKEIIVLNGRKFNIIDTAGLRESSDVIEQMGVSRTLGELGKADVIVFVTSAEREMTDEEKQFQKAYGGPKLLTVKNKIDLADILVNSEKKDVNKSLNNKNAELSSRDSHINKKSDKCSGCEIQTENVSGLKNSEGLKCQGLMQQDNLIQNADDGEKIQISQLPPESEILVSALNGKGIENLKSSIYNAACGADKIKEGYVLTNMRHTAALSECLDYLRETAEKCDDGEGIDVIAFLIRKVYTTLGKITGETESEKIIDEIFSKFCLGK